MNQSLQPLFEDELRIVDFFFDPKTEIIYFVKSIENKKVKFSTRVKRPDIAKARRVANRELRERLNRRKIRTQSLIKDELELWLRIKETEGLKPKTLLKVRQGKKYIDEYWGDKFPRDITRDNVAVWFEWWSQTHGEMQMFNVIKYMRNFCRYLAEKTVDGMPLLPAVPRIVDPNAKKAKALRQRKKERIITPEEFKKIHAAAPTINSRISSDDAKLIVLLMYTLGTRIDETLNLKFDEQIVLHSEMPSYRWQIDQNKAGLWGHQALHSSLIEPLKALRERRAAEGTSYLFPQEREPKKALREQLIDWNEWRKGAALDWHWTPHIFRHTCLSNVFNLPADKRASDAVLCKLYRVSIATALEHYIKVAQSSLITMRDAIRVEL